MNTVSKRVAKKPREKKVKEDKPLSDPTPWFVPENGFLSECPVLDDYAGFVYLVECKATGRKYIGRKYLWSHTRVKVANRKNRRRKTSTSNWQHYKTSCEELQADVKKLGVDAFTWTVLHLCKTRKETNYRELEEQVKRDVLSSKLPSGEWEFYNANVLARYFRSDVA